MVMLLQLEGNGGASVHSCFRSRENQYDNDRLPHIIHKKAKKSDNLRGISFVLICSKLRSKNVLRWHQSYQVILESGKTISWWCHAILYINLTILQSVLVSSYIIIARIILQSFKHGCDKLKCSIHSFICKFFFLLFILLSVMCTFFIRYLFFSLSFVCSRNF